MHMLELVRSLQRFGITTGLLAGWLCACASEVGSEQSPVIGSERVIEREIPVSVVQSLRIRVPFKVTLQNGEPKKIVLRGEDNLLERITVEEESVSSWRIVAPLDLEYRQHEDIAIEVPYIDMVEVKYRNNVRFIDYPAVSTHEAPGSPEG
jgi:hypothetical protein